MVFLKMRKEADVSSIFILQCLGLRIWNTGNRDFLKTLLDEKFLRALKKYPDSMERGKSPEIVCC